MANPMVTINHAGMAELFMSAGVKNEVHSAAAKVAAVAEALQGQLRATVTVEDATSDALGYGAIENRPVSAVKFTGRAWGTEGNEVAGTPESGKRAINHLAG